MHGARMMGSKKKPGAGPGTEVQMVSRKDKRRASEYLWAIGAILAEPHQDARDSEMMGMVYPSKAAYRAEMVRQGVTEVGGGMPVRRELGQAVFRAAQRLMRAIEGLRAWLRRSRK